MELTSNEALKQALIAEFGYSIMPWIGIKNELKNGDLHLIPFKGSPLTSNWDLVWVKLKKLSPTANTFLEFIKKEKEKIIENEFNWINKLDI